MGIFVYALHPRRSAQSDSLFPGSLDDLVSDNHLVRVIEAYVVRLDLREMGFSKTQHKQTGRPSYVPPDLLKLYLYGYFQRIRSSRRLEAECRRNTFRARRMPSTVERGTHRNSPSGAGLQPQTSD
jgi:transposase